MLRSLMKMPSVIIEQIAQPMISTHRCICICNGHICTSIKAIAYIIKQVQTIFLINYINRNSEI